MSDDPYLVAFLYGPVVLAARTDTDLVLNAEDADAALTDIHSTEALLAIRARLANGSDVELVPVNQIVDEPFGVYIRLKRNQGPSQGSRAGS